MPRLKNVGGGMLLSTKTTCAASRVCFLAVHEDRKVGIALGAPLGACKHVARISIDTADSMRVTR
jgi:hypothetical protein